MAWLGFVGPSLPLVDAELHGLDLQQVKYQLEELLALAGQSDQRSLL